MLFLKDHFMRLNIFGILNAVQKLGITLHTIFRLYSDITLLKAIVLKENGYLNRNKIYQFREFFERKSSKLLDTPTIERHIVIT